MRAAASSRSRGADWTLSGGDNGYTARGLYGWRVFLWSSLALCWLTGYRLVRLGLGPFASAGIILVVTAAVFVWLVVRALTNE